VAVLAWRLSRCILIGPVSLGSWWFFSRLSYLVRRPNDNVEKDEFLTRKILSSFESTALSNFFDHEIGMP
jgi:hypothetical protein